MRTAHFQMKTDDLILNHHPQNLCTGKRIQINMKFSNNIWWKVSKKDKPQTHTHSHSLLKGHVLMQGLVIQFISTTSDTSVSSSYGWYHILSMF